MLLLSTAVPAAAWPSSVYPGILERARDTMPEPLRQLLVDLEPVFREPCTVDEIDSAVRRAIGEFQDPEGSPARAVAALRDAGCAVAALNDPGMNALVEDQVSRFSVVFYGWHPAIQEGDLDGYLNLRRQELRELDERYRQTSELPSRSDAVELSPEFGVASIAYSHAVTDVANVWLYIWTSVNGAF